MKVTCRVYSLALSVSVIFGRLRLLQVMVCPILQDSSNNLRQVVYTCVPYVTKQYSLVPAKGRWCSVAGAVTAGLAESNGSLLPGGWLTVTCRLTACTPGSALGPTLGIEYGKPLPFFLQDCCLPRLSVCLSLSSVCLSVWTLMYCGQMVGCIKMPLGTEVGLRTGDIVLDGDSAPPRKGTQRPPPHFSAHVCCVQTVANLSSCWALVKYSCVSIKDEDN